MGPSEKPVRIVVADDDADDRFLIEDAFSEVSVDHELVFVEDGEELLELLRGDGRYADDEDRICPKLILLDLNMPRMDGREALKQIRADERLRNIPVVILTTSASDEDVLSAYGDGANSYISKPATFEDLIEITKTLTDYWGNMVRQSPAS
jgi:CheY-like chemotaxis protein